MGIFHLLKTPGTKIKYVRQMEGIVFVWGSVYGGFSLESGHGNYPSGFPVNIAKRRGKEKEVPYLNPNTKTRIYLSGVVAKRAAHSMERIDSDTSIAPGLRHARILSGGSGYPE